MNLFIGDNFFKTFPEKVLGEQSIVSGRFGSDMIKVKGDISSLEKIDTTPVQAAVENTTPNQSLTTAPKQEIIEKVFEIEKESAAKEVVKSRRAKSKTSKEAYSLPVQEVYTTKEVGAIYNKSITREELEAYYFSHPELNYKLLFDEFQFTKEQLVEKGLLCFDGDRYEYLYTFQSGNISKKIQSVKQKREKIVAEIGEVGFNTLLAQLEAAKPVSAKLSGENSLIILPHSEFARQFKITEIKSPKPSLNGEVSLFSAFNDWIRTLPSDAFKRSNYREISEYYLMNKSIPISTTGSKEMKERDERNAINIKQRTKEEGDELFQKFLLEELTDEDKAKVEYLWNEKFNSIAEPNLTKIPVAFRVSKTFKAGAPFVANPTQRQGVAFSQEKKSGLFAYGVGVGKTTTAILCASQALENGLANYPLFVVPTNTFDKWIGEIQGYEDAKSGQFIHGLLPHLPPVVGLFNLNPEIVRNKLKDYSEEDEAIFEKYEDVIEKIKAIEYKQGDFESSSKIEAQLARVQIARESLIFEYSSSNSTKNMKDFTLSFVRDSLKQAIYERGTVKQFPRGTIFVITEVGLQRLGISETNREELVNKLYSILSQGDTSDPKRAKEVAKLRERIEQTVSSSLKNAKINIEDLGVDFVCFDESHYYKKLFTYVKGSIKSKTTGYDGKESVDREKSKYEIKSGQYPSSRALSAYVVSHFVQSKNDNRNVIQLTATPFTNSPLEVFSMLTLTNYKALEELGLDNMTDFFDTFMKISYDIVYTAKKTVEKKQVLNGYNNLPQLRQIIYSLMDKKDEGANLKRPTKHIYPSIQKGIETTLPMTAEQDELIARVKDYMTKQGVNLDFDSEEEDDEYFDSLEDEALINAWETATSKEFEGDRNLSEDVRDKLIGQLKKASSGGVSFDESSLSEEENAAVKVLKGIGLMRQITLSPYLFYKAIKKSKGEEIKYPTYREYVTSSPKLMYVMGCVKSVIDYHRSKGERISGQVIYMNTGIEYFPLIKEYAVRELGLTESQVGIVSGNMSKSAKEAAKQAFLSGDMLLLIGSSTISVGVDLQNNSTVLYNCYYDWNPTDSQQIEGRIWRQGNRFANVRIVYPQCYNSADPVIFEYLNSKTLRINEIWNRDSVNQELDLKDFDPKELQKKLITDPAERADWEILEEQERISSQVIYFENRRDLLVNAITAHKNFLYHKPIAIENINKLANRRLSFTRQAAIQSIKDKIDEITEKYAQDPDKLASEIEKVKKSRYDYEKDPDNKFGQIDVSTYSNEKLYNEAKKWIDIVRDWSYNDEIYQEFYYSKTAITETLRYLIINYREMASAEEKVLKPMGLTFDTAGGNPIQTLNDKIESLRKEGDELRDSRDRRIEAIRAELAALPPIKSVSERVQEFASRNEELLSAQLSTATDVVKIELPEPIITETATVEKPIEQIAKETVHKQPTKEELAEKQKEIIRKTSVILNGLRIALKYQKDPETIERLNKRIKGLEIVLKVNNMKKD